MEEIGSGGNDNVSKSVAQGITANSSRQKKKKGVSTPSSVKEEQDHSKHASENLTGAGSRTKGRAGFEPYVPRRRGKTKSPSSREDETESTTQQRNAMKDKSSPVSRAASSSTPNPKKEATRRKELKTSKVAESAAGRHSIQASNPSAMMSKSQDALANVEKELQRRRQQREQEERMKREQAKREAERAEVERRRQESIVRKIEEENMKKIARAELMFNLLQSHKNETEGQDTSASEINGNVMAERPHSRGQDSLKPSSDNAEALIYGFSAEGKSSSMLYGLASKWEIKLRDVLTEAEEDDQEGDDMARDQTIRGLRNAIREAYRELLCSHLQFAFEKNIDQRLWANWYKEIDILQRRVKEARQRAKTQDRGAAGLTFDLNISASEATRLQDKLRAVISEASTFYSRLVQTLLFAHSADAEPQGGEEGLELSKTVLQRCLISLGDLMRYSEQYSPNSAKDWTKAEQHYLKAVQISPGNGKAFNQLAVVATYRRDVLSAMYMYLRAVTAAAAFPARENIMSISHKAHLQVKSLKGKSSSGRQLTLDSALEDFSLHVVNTGGILFTHIEEEYFERDMSACLKALAALLQAMEYKYVQILHEKSSRYSEEGPAAKLLDRICLYLTRAIAIAISLLFNSQKPLPRGDTCKAEDFDIPLPWEKNRSIQRAAVFLFGIGQQILGSCERAVRFAHLDTKNFFIHRMAGPVSVILDILQTHSNLLELSNGEVTNFRVKLTSVLNRLMAHADFEESLVEQNEVEGEESLNDCPEFPILSSHLNKCSSLILDEDVELRGWLPLRKKHEERFQKKFEVLSGSQNATSQLTAGSARSYRCLAFALFAVGLQWIYPSVHQGKLIGFQAEPTLLLDIDNQSNGVDEDDIENASGDVKEETAMLQGVSNISINDGLDLPEGFDVLQNMGGPGGTGIDPSAANGSGNTKSTRQRAATRQFPLGRSGFSLATSSTFEGGSRHNKLSGKEEEPGLVVIDAANVAMRHGMNNHFSCKGIVLAMEFYQQRGHKVIAFLPDYYTRYEDVGKMRRLAKAGFDVGAAKVPDDVPLLRSLVDRGLVVPTPPQDYDDSYCIQYARSHNGCVVTNDLFRDHMENLKGSREEKQVLRQFLKSHVISYTWVGDEFLPNPDFRFPR